MKTAMQELIDNLIKLDKQLDGRRKNEDSTVFKMSPDKLYKKALEKEKEQIIEAFEQGLEFGFPTNGSNYFNKTFNQNK